MKKNLKTNPFIGSKAYSNALARLYGNFDVEDEKEQKTLKTRLRRSKKGQLTKESSEQITFVQWLSYKGILHHSIPNEGGMNGLRVAKLKRMGLTPGVPDICIPIRRGAYGSCYIELKRSEGGRLSASQREFIARLISAGNFVYIAEGANKAIAIVEEYLSGRHVSSNFEEF